VVYKDDVALVGWKDSKEVYCASNKFKGTSQSSCSRYNCAEHKYVNIQIPECIQAYNQGMGGVDIMDKIVAGYRPKYRIKKWWWPIYAWSIALAAVQAWRLRCKTTKSKQLYCQFLHELTAQLFAKNGSESKPGRPVQPQMIPRSIQDLVPMEQIIFLLTVNYQMIKS